MVQLTDECELIGGKVMMILTLARSRREKMVAFLPVDVPSVMGV